jgi:hypothetical protein
MIKLFLTESLVEVESTVDIKSINDVESKNVQLFDDENQNLAFKISARFIQARRLFLRYQNFADITVFLQDEDDSSFIFTLNSLFTFVFT